MSCLALLAVPCLTGCYVLPQQGNPNISAVTMHSSSFFGLKMVAVTTEIGGQESTGPIRSVVACTAVSSEGAVSVEVVSYRASPVDWCVDDDLAREFAAVLVELHRYTGVAAPVRKLVVRVLPEGMGYRRIRWTLGRTRLRMDFALDAAQALQIRKMLTLPTDSLERSEDYLLKRSLVRILAHELFHLSVDFSARRARRDFSAQFADELAAYLLEPCVELSVLGHTRGGKYNGARLYIKGDSYTGAEEGVPRAIVHSKREAAFAATVFASVRAERLLNDITAARLVDRDSPEAAKIFATCRKAADDFMARDLKGK